MVSGQSVAIDLGSTATRVVHLSGAPGQWELKKSLEFAPHPETSLSEVVSQLKAEKIPLKHLVIGISGQAASLRYNSLPPVPDWRLDMIMKYETEEFAERSGEALSCAFKRLDLFESESDDLMLLVALGKDLEIQSLIDEVEQGGGAVTLASPTALGIYHSYRHSTSGVPDESVLLVDIGENETHVVLVTDGRLVFARSTGFGGSNLDESIASSLSLTPAQARKLKEGMAGDKIPDHLKESAQTSIRSGLGQLSQIIQSSITFCRSQTKISEINIDRVLLSGAGSQLPSLCQYLESVTNMKCELHRPQIGGASFPQDATVWTTAMGLAISGLDRDGMRLDLLPAKAKQKREFRERTLFMYASAAVLLIAVLIAFAASFVAGSKVEEVNKQVKSEQRSIDNLRNQLAAAERNNSIIEKQISRLHKEVAQSNFIGHLMTSFDENMPAPISLASLKTNRSIVNGEIYLSVLLEGEVDNSDAKGLDHLRRFEQSLKAVEGVERTELPSPQDTDGHYPFELSVSPDAVAPPAQDSRGKNRRSGRRAR